MSIKKNFIFIFLSLFLAFPATAETKVSCQNIETIPRIKDPKKITLKKLKFTNLCLKEYAEIKIKGLKKPAHNAEVIEFVLYDMKEKSLYKDIGNVFFSNLDKKELQQLFEISVKNFPQTTFLFWFFHHNKDDTLIQTFKNYYKINKLAGLYVAKFILEYRYDDKIKDFKKIIEPVIGQTDFNLFLIEHLKTKNFNLRNRICEYYLFFRNHKPSTNKVLEIVEQNFSDGDKSFHSCLLKHYTYQKRDQKKMASLLNQVEPYEQIYPELFFNYLHLKPQDKINNKEFKIVFETLIKSDYDKYVYANFINKFYPNLIKIPVIDETKGSKIDECIIKNFSCLNNSLSNLVIDKLTQGMRDIYLIASTLNYNADKILDSYTQTIKKSKLTVFQKAFIFDQLEINSQQFKKNNRAKFREFIFKNQTELWMKHAKQISKSDKLSKRIEVLYVKDLMSIFNVDIEKSNEVMLSPWFHKALKQIPHATSNNYFDLMNSWLMYAFFSDYKDKGSIYANQLSKRWVNINPNQLNHPIYLQTLWLLSLLDEENSYTHLTLGAELSKNNPEKNDLFKDLKSRYFVQQGNYELANKFAKEGLKFLELKLLTPQLKKFLNNSNNISNIPLKKGISIGRLCDATTLVSQTNRNLNFGVGGIEILGQYCKPFFDYFLDELPAFALEYIGERLLYEILLIDLGKIKNFSSSTIDSTIKILQKETINDDLKYVLAFYLGHYQKYANLNDKNFNIDKLIKKYSKQTINNKFVVDKFWVFSKNFKIARESLSDKSITDFHINGFKNLTNASLVQVIDNLNERFKTSYVTSSKGLINNPVVLESLLSDYLELKKTGHFDNNFDEKFYEVYNLLKIDQPEKLILNQLDKANFSKENSSKLTRRKFLIDTLVYNDFDSDEREKLVKELSSIQRSINKSSKITTDNIKLLSIKEIQNKLNPDEIYLNYLTNASSNLVALYAISKNDYAVHFIKDLQIIKSKITSLKRNLDKEINQGFINDGYYLYNSLIRPFIKSKTNKVIISPHSFLYGVPFHILSTTPYKKKEISEYIFGKKYEWFGLKKQIIIQTNLSIKNNNFDNNQNYSFFGVGNPVFSIQNNTDNEIKLGLLDTNTRGIMFSEKEFPELKETQNEIEAISKLPMFSSSTLLLKNNATEQNIKNSKKLSIANVISFATHGLAYGEMNRHSEPGLLMTKDNKDNGYLSMSEIAALNLDADLVILSACNTGSSASINSSPFSGLATSFLAAGSKRVLASHWSVNDQSTSLLMQEILKAKFNNTVSWSEAHFKGIKNFMSKYKKFQSPYFWGAFTLFEQ